MNKLVKTAIIAGGVGIAASLAGRAILRRSRSFEWAGKNVLVTGGSRGLGLCLARESVRTGANVAICARTQSELDVAVSQLNNLVGPNNRVVSFVCDVRDRDSVESMVADISWQLGPIGRDAAKGHESESKWSPSIFTRLTNLAAIRNNQL